MKKILVGLLSVILCFSVLAGCNFDDDEDDQSAVELGANPDAPVVKLAHWDSSGSLEKAVLNAVLKQFYKSHPNGQKIQVEVSIQNDYETTMPMLLGSPNEKKPEIIMMPDGSFNNWMTKYGSQFENLDPYIVASGFDEDELWESAVSRYKYKNENGKHYYGEGNVYSLPKDVSPNVMFYNKDFFTEKGVTMPLTADGKAKRLTTTEAVAIWKALIAGEEDKTAVNRRYALAGMPAESMLWSAGSDFLNETRTGFITDANQIAGFKKAYQFMVDLTNDYIVPKGNATGGESGSSGFLTGKMACFIGGAYEAAQFRSASFDWDITYIPAFEDNMNVNGYSGSVGYAMHVGTSSELKDLVYSVIEYIASEEAQKIMAEMGFNIPYYKNVLEDDAFIDNQRAKKPYQYEVFLESSKYQPSGTWRYCENNSWKKRFDTEVAKLYQATGGYTVDDLVRNLPAIIAAEL